MKNAKYLIAALFLLIASCKPINSVDSPVSEDSVKQEKFSYAFFGSFDTVMQIIGFAPDEETFNKNTEHIENRMLELHKLYDIYNSYEGINNAKTVNDNAGIKPVEVSEDLLDLVEQSLLWYGKTNNTVNIAMGSVLKIWHEYREDGASLPDIEKLRKAYELTSIDGVVIDRENSTLFLKEKGMSLDLGSCAKGYAAGKVASEISDMNFIISAGGNIVAKGNPLDGREFWTVGIQDPNQENLLNDTPILLFYIKDACVVTSGDYQRYYVVDGVRYNHIINPETLMPADYFRSVSVIAPDSGISDILSTALFVLPYDEGKELIESFGYDAVWIFEDGEIRMTAGAEAIRVS